MEFSNEMAKDLIISHYETPLTKTKKIPNKIYIKGHSNSPSCIDDINGYVYIKNGILKDAKFSGVGCAICTSSTDLLNLEIINKPISKAKEIIDNYLNMILGKKYNKKIIGKMIVYKNVNKQANRIKCAITGIEAINKAIINYEKKQK